MPRFRPKPKLERSALADLWKHTLSQIPTCYGRLSYLASLRDANSGAYRHHGLISTFGREDSTRALRESHEQAFSEWLNLSLAQQARDLREYLTALEDSQAEVLDHWIQSGAYRTYAPASALEMETELFCRDLEALYETLRNGSGASRPDRGS